MTCADLLRTQAFVDGELDEAASRDAESHIENCAECRAFVASAAATSDLIRHHAATHAAPDSLRHKVIAQLDADTGIKSREWRSAFWIGAGSGSAAMALAAGFALFLMLPPSVASLPEALVAAHTQAMMDGREIQVASSNHHTVKPWFAGKIALSPPVADFADDGFALTGGRIQRVKDIDMAVVVYRHGAHELDLFVWPDSGAALPDTALRHGYRAMFGKKGDLDFAAVSDTENAELKKFTALVRSERE
ncbi:MAG TPA: zf-HC2 domain-containing protein [Rhizomicrobium sp.]|jgi:anti-sigma factor RsiW|nr:zf-HC2 domain-containing protein [Rhizomicrobium sp.]